MRIVVRSQAPASNCPCATHDYVQYLDHIIDVVAHGDWDDLQTKIPTLVKYAGKVDRFCGTNLVQYEKALNAVAKAENTLLFNDLLQGLHEELCGESIRVFTPEKIERKAEELMARFK